MSDGLRAGEFTATHTGPLTAAQMRDGGDLAAYEWRTSGQAGRLIYAVRGYDRDLDAYVGSMLTAELAAAVVDEHNAAIRQAAGTDCQPLAAEVEVPDGR